MKGKTSVLVTAVLLATVVGGCGDDTGSGALGTSASPVPAGEPSPSAGNPLGASAPPCVAGNWRSSGATGQFAGAAGRITGGTGTTMTVGTDGTTELGFAGSEPLTFSARAAGSTVKGQVTYSGSVHAGVRFQPGSDGAGRWQPQEATDNDLRVTVKLTEPFSVTLLDNAGIGRLTGGELPGTDEALDALPVLRGGTYTCTDDKLKVRTQENGPDLTWAFSRTV